MTTIKTQPNTQREMVRKFLTEGTAKAELARQYNVSPRTVARYIDTLRGEVENELSAKTSSKRKAIVRDAQGYTPRQKWIWDTWQKQRGTLTKEAPRQGVASRAPAGVKTIRYITMDILERQAAKQVAIEKNKEKIIKLIEKEANVNTATARQYFSGHKIFFVK